MVKYVDGLSLRQAIRDVAEDYLDLFGSALGNNFSKLIIDQHENFIVTSDGSSLIHELNYIAKNPIQSIILNNGEVQGKKYGDLSKSNIVFTCNLILNALNLERNGIHPSNIKRGYFRALNSLKKLILEHAKSFNLEINDLIELLWADLAQSLSVPVARHLSTIFGPIVHEFISKKVIGSTHDQEIDSTRNFDLDLIQQEFFKNFHFILKPGGRILDSRIVNGVAIPKMPINWRSSWTLKKLSTLKDLRVVLISGNLYLERKKYKDIEHIFNTPAELQAYQTKIQKIWNKKACILKNKNVHVLITERGIDKHLISALIRSIPLILIFRRVKRKQMEALGRLTGAKIAHNIERLTEDDIGQLERIETIQVRGENQFIARNSKENKQYTLIISGLIYEICKRVQDLVEKSIKSIFSFLGGVIDNFPWSLEKLIRENMHGVSNPSGRRINAQAAEASKSFFNAFLSIPMMLRINRGIDPFNVNFTPDKRFMVPTKTLLFMLTSATEVATKLIGIDYFIVNDKGWNLRMQNRK
ncbi:MAG: TCP-1/cpn60 chaperonin family protein, partial [Promethearchaeota archaeon]